MGVSAGTERRIFQVAYVCTRGEWPIRLVPSFDFSSMKRLGVYLLLPGWDASPLQGYPPALNSLLPIDRPGGERLCESKVSCPRTQHNVLSKGLNPINNSIQKQMH